MLAAVRAASILCLASDSGLPALEAGRQGIQLDIGLVMDTLGGTAIKIADTSEERASKMVLQTWSVMACSSAPEHVQGLHPAMCCEAHPMG